MFIYQNMSNKLLNLLGKADSKWLDVPFVILLISSLSFFLILRGWTNTTLYILLALSLLFFPKTLRYVYRQPFSKRLIPVIIILSLPVLAIVLSQAGRGDWLIKAYDGPSRMFFSIFILLFFAYKRVNFSRLIAICAPLTLFFTMLSVYRHPEVIAQWGRYATTFVDPNAFGTYMVIFTGFCLFNIDPSMKTKKTWLIYQLAGLLTGIYLLFGSSTRGSWLALPVILIMWLYLNRQKLSLQFTAVFILLILFSAPVISYLFPHVGDRISSTLVDINNWFDHRNLDTSSGLRLSMWKISWQLFLHHPFWGYGDKGYIGFLNEPWFSSSASAMAKETIICCGPHNELLSNTLRYGIVGSIAVICLFLVPLILFVRHCNHCDPDIAHASRLGLVYIICLTICSITMEVFNLKYTSTFYGLMIAGLFAQIIPRYSTQKL